MRTVIGIVLVLLVLSIGCSTQPLERYGYLPDGRMVLLQSSGEDKPVAFPDANLELVVRETLESMNVLAANEPIYTTDLEEIVSLGAFNRNITDLTGLESCLNLYFVDLRENNVSNISPLTKLPGLLFIGLDETGREVTRYTYLRLELAFNQIGDIAPLSGLAGVGFLSIDLSGNGISDLTPLSSLSGLQHLYLQYNDIADVSALGELSNLTVLALGQNHIEDVSPLVWCSHLESLSLWNNRITDITPLTELENLTQLSLDGNLISELPSLLGRWQQMSTLILSYNQIKDASEIKYLPETCEVVLEGNPLE